MRVRPAELADGIKSVLRVSRLLAESENGCRYEVDPVSNLGQHLLEEGSFESGMSALLTQVLRPGDVFLDVGGNEGYFSVQAAACLGATAVCVEPQARLQRVIERNLELNGCLERVEVLQLALGESEGFVRLNLRSSLNTGASGIHSRSRFSSAVDEVRCTSLDNLLEARGNLRIRLMKVDCEGAEREVLAGAPRSLAHGNFDFIALEYHPAVIGQPECDRIHERLTEAGYNKVNMTGQAVYRRSDLPDREMG